MEYAYLAVGVLLGFVLAAVFALSRAGGLAEVFRGLDVAGKAKHNPAFAEKLFGAFQRLHNIEEFEGHGIGLAMVERVVRMHDGRAWAEGAPDLGATIWLSFPHAKEHP